MSSEPRQDANTASALHVSGLSMKFNGRPALTDAHLELRPGEVHGLVGQNGCGKSTLIKILAGYHQPEPGADVTVRGEPLALGHAAAARAAGLRFIHQDLGLVGELGAVDNLALGESYCGRWWLSNRRERTAARSSLADYGVDVDVDAPVRTFSAARQSLIAVVRALRSGLVDGHVLVLDEPTASLPAEEVGHLFELVRTLRERGVSILLVTHRLSEVLDVADRVTVMRDGRTVATRDVSTLTHDSLAELIIGRPAESFYPDPAKAREARVLDVDDIAGGSVKGVSLTLHRGETVGIAGIVGSGYEDVLALIFGASSRRRGCVELDGAEVSASPNASVRAGLAFAPADRKRLGAILTWTLRENVTLPALPTGAAARWLSERAERRDARTWLQRLDVTADPERHFWTLSGGNQQRVVLARWLRRSARVFLLEEPTNGVDLGARRAIYEAIAETARGGAGVLMSSSDAEELCAVCDRVLVMRGGVVAASLEGAQLTVDNLQAESLRDGEPAGPQLVTR